MTKDLKILILTGSYGNGHLKVSNTLKENFLKLGMNQVTVSDLYLKSFTYGRKLYGMFYYRVNKKKYFQEDFMNYYGLKKLTQLVETLKPDIIVNTFPMLVVPEFTTKTGFQIPVVNVLTDYDLHKNWIHKKIDKYYVASKNLKFDLMDIGTSIGNIKVTGIPIDANFEKKCDRELLFGKYHLDLNKPVILIAAGAFGVLKNIEDTVTKLKNIKDNQIIVVCGNNWKLKEKLVIHSLGEDNVRIFGYTNQMDELMKMATVVVTKPGGITLSEALSIQVPLILYRSVPGQEEENAVFFEKNGTAIIAEKPNDLIENISNLIQN